MNGSSIFGPVASRRLGISLGVDLVTPKCCTLNCVYCEAGETTERTTVRRELVPAEKVIRELDAVLAKQPELDYITFSGAGEPTLNPALGRVADFVKKQYPQYKLCLLTNGTLLQRPELRAEIAGIDLVVPSFDASNDAELQIINRPAPGISVEGIAAGIRDFSHETSGTVVLELFIVPGVNDSDAAIARFSTYIKTFKITKVQLNTLDRPGCCEWIQPSTPENTRRFIKAFEPFIPVEAVGTFRYQSPILRQPIPISELDAEIFALISRRPATLPDLVVALKIDETILKNRLNILVNSGSIQSERRPRGEFFLL